MSKVKLYYRINEKGIPFDNFCSDAAIGADEEGIDCIPFSDIKKVPKDPYHIVITSVEESQEWLGKKVNPINDSWAEMFKGRLVEYKLIKDIEEYPCFIKPAEDIKAFTGLVVSNEGEAKLFTQDYKGLVEVQEPIKDIESEYRIYVHRDRGILGIKHYLGDPYKVPKEDFINNLVKAAKQNLTENSFTLDVYVDSINRTCLIEVNDGWAIGNYGLSPKDYYSFVKTRWLQLTGVLK